MTDTFVFPNSTQRALIIGRTGSGKSMMGSWLLSHADFDRRPWLVIDYKYEALFRDPAVKHLFTEIRPTSRMPKKKGLYIVHPLPNEGDQMEDLLWRVWDRGRTGVLVDEGYMLPDRGAFQALITQGRAKRIPMIILTQRPVEMNRFAVSEADFYALFRLQDDRDWKTVEAFTPLNRDMRLPPYHSWWYDVARDRTFHLRPVPEKDTILDRIALRAPRSIWWS